jgi:hypothetical protein
MRHENLPLTCTVLLLAASCLPATSTDEEVDQIEQPAYVLANRVWDSTDIAVCWENPSDDNAEARGWVRDAVEGSWVAHSRLQFYGWGPCSDGQHGIRIVVEDDRPHVKSLGNGLDGLKDGMRLNFTFDHWNGHACKDDREFCIRADAIHEFGHAIGFAHEQNRPDTPEWCNDVQGTQGDAVIGPWDEGSVMNYCNDKWNNNGKLSHFDKIAVGLTYGTSEHRGVSLRNVMASNCLDVEHASPNDGANLHSWDCHGDLNQRWDLLPSGGGYRIVSRRSFKCVDIAEASTGDGANAVQWGCHDDHNQLFSLQPRDGGYQIVAAHSGKCLDVDYGSSQNGANILQWTCHGSGNQIWQIVP